MQRMVGLPLRWAARKPKRPGWWWLAAPNGYTPRLVKVWENEDGKLIVNAESPGWPLSRPYRAGCNWKGCRWYGPLVAPPLTVRTKSRKPNEDSAAGKF